MFPHMVEEKVCGSGSRDCSDSGNKICALCDGTDDNHDRIVSCRFGSLKMMSTLIVSHRADGIGRGCSSPVGGRQNDLVRRHMSQVERYLPTYLNICGHQ